MDNIKNITAKVSPEEKAKLERWQKEYALNADTLSRFITQLEAGETNLDGYKQYNSKKAWNNVVENTGLNKSSFNWMRVAAAVAFLMVASFAFQQFFMNGTGLVEKEYVSIDKVNFPDGSVAQVDKGSKVSYTKKGFGDDRKLDFEGRAFFKVQATESKTFTINTEAFEVQVLGTEFVVNTINGFKSVKVIEGKVKVTTKTDEVLLTANQKATIKGTQIIKEENVGIANALSWGKEVLVFNDTPLSAVIADLSSHFNYIFEVDPESTDLSCKINTEFRKESFESIMEELKLLVGATFAKNGNKVVLSNIQCK